MAELQPDFDISTAAAKIKWKRSTAKFERNRSIWMAKTFEGLSYGDISKRYGISRPRAFQIVKRVKRLIANVQEIQARES